MNSQLVLPVTGRLDVAHALQVLEVHSLPNQEQLQIGQAGVRRVLRFGGGCWLTQLMLRPASVIVQTEADDELLPELRRIVIHWLGLEDPGAAGLQRLAADDLLGPAARSHPQLRLIGYPDLFETLATTVLGQQISTRAARTLGTRYLEALGALHDSGLKAYPDASATARTDPGALAGIIGCPLSRAQTLQRVAAWYLEDYPRLHADPEAMCASLMQVKGIGPWSVDYVRLRGLRDARVFLAGDLVVRRILERRGFSGRPGDLDWGEDNAIATVLLWRTASESAATSLKTDPD